MGRSAVAARMVSRPPCALRRTAVEFVRPMTGGSKPSLLRCDNGAYYVVKFQTNPQHVRVLANEMLAARAALSVGLPVAEPALVEIAPDLIEASQPIGWHSRSEIRRLPPGIHFGSRYPGEPSETLVTDLLPDALLRQLSNFTGCFWGAFLFDKWTCNCDVRQFVFYRPAAEKSSKYTARLIDNGFCFNDGDWSFPDRVLLNFYPRRWVYEGVRGFRSFEPYLSRIESLTPSQVEGWIRDIPSEWCGEDGSLDALFGVAEQLYARRRKLRQALLDARDSEAAPFPNWK